MGNRGIITIQDDKGTLHPVALYVHWNGGLESVLAFMTYTWNAYERGHDDLFTFHARLCQVIGCFFPDGLSVYAYPARQADSIGRNCDNGHFQFTLAKSGPQLTRAQGQLEAVTNPETLAELTAEAKAHEYWTRAHTILDQIHDRMPSCLTSPMSRELNPILALQCLKDCIPDDPLPIPASDEEHAAIIKVIDGWNTYAAPVLQAHAEKMPQPKEARA